MKANASFDLACGTGLLTLRAKNMVGTHGNVVGIDISIGMLEDARRKSDRRHPTSLLFSIIFPTWTG